MKNTLYYQLSAVDAIEVSFDSQFDFLYDEIFKDEVYKKAFEGFSKKKDLTIIDLGANIGMFSIYAYPYAKTIYAIEPFSKNRRNLIANIKKNKLDNVIVSDVAISDYKETALMYATDDNLVGAKIVRPPFADPAPVTEVVSTMTLAQFMDSNKIDHVDILKVDIEGEELHVFNSPDFKDASLKIDRIIGEHFADEVNPILDTCGFKTSIINDSYFYAQSKYE